MCRDDGIAVQTDLRAWKWACHVTPYWVYSQFWLLTQVFLWILQRFLFKMLLECGYYLRGAGSFLAVLTVRGARCKPAALSCLRLAKEGNWGHVECHRIRCKKKLNSLINYSANYWSKRNPWISLAVVTSRVMAPQSLEIRWQQSHSFHVSPGCAPTTARLHRCRFSARVTEVTLNVQ